jgi:hypothetical protein
LSLLLCFFCFSASLLFCFFASLLFCVSFILSYSQMVETCQGLSLIFGWVSCSSQFQMGTFYRMMGAYF